MSTNFNKISIIGLGYIGLPTAAIIAAQKTSVIGIDINETTVEIINSGKVHIVEPDLEKLVRHVVDNHYLRASLQPEPADAFLITVPTPFNEKHEPDLSYVIAAVKSIAPVLKKNDLIILESTSPVGTTEQISIHLSRLRKDLIFPHQNTNHSDIYIAYCPERVMPGKILRELTENARIIGGVTERCGNRAKELYQLFVKGDCIVTHCRTAEMTKLTENAFRDVNIAFANELSMICDKLNINVWELIKLANHHPRVNILQPGPGVGGHCIAVDPWFIVNAAPNQAKLIRTAREVNDSKPQFVIDKITSIASYFMQPIIACFGLTYKPETDDLRESPAVEIVHQLLERGMQLMVVEPHIRKLPALLQNEKCKLVPLNEALELSNIAVLMVNHKEFNVLHEHQFSQPFISLVSDYKKDSLLHIKHEPEIALNLSLNFA